MSRGTKTLVVEKTSWKYGEGKKRRGKPDYSVGEKKADGKLSRQRVG